MVFYVILFYVIFIFNNKNIVYLLYYLIGYNINILIVIKFLINKYHKLYPLILIITYYLFILLTLYLNYTSISPSTK